MENFEQKDWKRVSEMLADSALHHNQMHFAVDMVVSLIGKQGLLHFKTPLRIVWMVGKCGVQELSPSLSFPTEEEFSLLPFPLVAARREHALEILVPIPARGGER